MTTRNEKAPGRHSQGHHNSISGTPMMPRETHSPAAAMSYALLSDDVLLKLEHGRVSRDARLLHIEATVYCATALTDGELAVRLSRISDAEDPAALARELATAGVWEETSTGWRILDYLEALT
ncbi:MAG: hypothetical protein Q7V58_07285 [Actinomycetota bacterium]|nr:hypothetical protein [Actinomycetota bacterium]